MPSNCLNQERRSAAGELRIQGIAIATARAFTVLAILGTFASTASSCPFCVAVKPTLSQQRASADVVVFGELIAARQREQVFRVHHVIKGEPMVGDAESLTVPADVAREVGTLAVLFGAGSEALALEEMRWSTVTMNETSLGYFIQAPPDRAPATKRLAYYARFLQHRDSLIAEDAYLEFGHAPFADVVRVVDHLPSEKLRAWIADLNIPQERKGFFALALGFPRSPDIQAENAAFLREIILMPASDFRAGFDGVIGGYLLATGEAGLELIEQHILENPDAAEGDLRHVAGALRAYYEIGKTVPPRRLARSVRLLLARPSLAARAIIDLGRWEDWGALPEIVDLYDPAIRPTVALRRAIVGYLMTCPLKEAEEALAALREGDPQGVSEAERFFQATSGGRS